MADDCVNRISGLDDETKQKLFGDIKIPKDVIRRFVNDIEAIKRAAAADPKLGTFQSRVAEYVRNQREFSKITKEVRKQDLLKAKALMDFAKQPALKGDVPKAVIAKLTFMSELANGGKDSAQYRGLAIHEKLLTLLLSDLDKNPADLKILQSGLLDKEIGIETRALGLNEGVGQTGNEQAMRIAKSIHQMNKAMMREHINSGVPLADMPGYVAPLTHDVQAIRAAGEEKWVADMKANPWIDKKATFGESAGDPKAEDEILRSMYKGVSLGKSGVNTALTVDSFDEMIYGQNLSKRLTQSRSIRFSSYEGEHLYNSQYGRDTLLNTITSNIDRKSRALGLIQIFGSNPERQILTTFSRMEASFRSAGNFEAADKIKRDGGVAMNRLHELTGRSSIPGNNTLDKVGSFVRAINVVSKLFNVTFRKLIDFPTGAMALKSYTGGGFLEHMSSMVSEFSKSATDKTTTRHVGEFFSNLASEMSNADRGVMPKLTRLQMKINGINFLTDHIENAYARTFQGIMGEHAVTGFSSLPERVQATLLSIGIGQEDWAHLSKGVEVAADGKTYLTPEGISKIDKESVKARVSELNKATKGLKMTPERYINELQNKYLGISLRGGETAGNVAGAEERAVLNRGTYRGTLQGEVARLLTQFKSFWVKSFNSTLLALNANPDKAQLAKGILMTGKKDFITPAEWMAASTAVSYIGGSLLEISRGKNPEDPRHIATWMKALGHAGAGGMIGELATPDPQFGLAEQALGPTFGQLFGPGAKLIGQVEQDLLTKHPRSGDTFSATSKNMAMRLVRSNIPFQQAPVATQLLDAFQESIQESLTPGFKAKKSVKNILEDRKNRVNIGFGGQ